MPARIIILEDNPASLELMIYLLTAFDHNVLTASDGIQGLRVIHENGADIIVCDVHMPGMDGYGVAKSLKSNPSLSKIPLIAVTALAMVGDRDKVLSAGFDGYVSKPIEPETFVQDVEKFLPESLRTQQAKPPIPTMPEAPTSSTKARILVVDDNPINIHLHYSVLEPMGYNVLSAANITEARRIMKVKQPDLIISDVRMQQGTGFDFLETLKADPEFSKIPVVLISSTYRDEVSRQKGLELGAVKYLFRPIDPDVFVAEIEECLDHKFS